MLFAYLDDTAAEGGGDGNGPVPCRSSTAKGTGLQAGAAFKQAAEVIGVGIADGCADLVNLHIGFLQQRPGFADAHVGQVFLVGDAAIFIFPQSILSMASSSSSIFS